ncbi:sensor histidine kinase [Draconibacterium halophilum]|uniref:histidine kinase n=1 Tax=Draconibacterium halophilum TaxID=2706887 RepID=A0A6C0R9T7_9BACT|nr:ATP-binding protein [Draconibacterium halophilum]QIA06475.1 ATP-binding protein [Draconibacterium halophilum]
MTVLDLLENEPELTETDRKSFMSTINTLSQSTYHLLLNLLDWASKSKNRSNFETEVLNLNQLISENLSFFKSSATVKSIEMEFNQGQGIFLDGNKNMLQTILRNLVSNAIKFTPEKGRISIRTTKTNDKIQLQITDTGRGMDEKTLKSLHRFKQGESKQGTHGEAGSGLGLVLCNEFVGFHKGTLRFESEPGKGTTAILEFRQAI